MPDISPMEWTAILLSLRVAVIATLVATPFGIALAWLLARRDFGTFAGCGRRRAFLLAVMTLAIAIVMRTTFIRTVSGSPVCDTHRFVRGFGDGFVGCAVSP